MREYVKDAENVLLPEGLQNKFKNLVDATDRQLREEWVRIQQLICTIIHQDFCTRSGVFIYGHILPYNDEVELHLEMSREDRPFNSLKGCLPFPSKPTT
jgi:hypothetical protein